MPFKTLEKIVHVEDVPIRVMSYNVLAQSCIRRDTFSYTSQKVLKWNYRKNILLKEILDSKSQIVCLQEVDSSAFTAFWQKNMTNAGYSCYFKSKPVDEKNKNNTYGVCIFFQKDFFECVDNIEINFQDMANGLTGPQFEELSRNNVAQVMALQLKSKHANTSNNNSNTDNNSNSNSPQLIAKSPVLIVANTHLFWNPRYDWVRIKQTTVLLETIKTLSSKWNAQNIPCHTILCGDLNSTPKTLVYRFLTAMDIDESEHNQMLVPENDSNNIVDAVNESLSGELVKNLRNRQPKNEDDYHRLEEIKVLMQYAKSNLPLMKSLYSWYWEVAENPNKREDYRGEPPWTSYSIWAGTLDYILMEQSELERIHTFGQDTSLNSVLVPVSILDIPSQDVLTKETALPNELLVSDHFCIVAEFVLRVKNAQ